MIQLTNTHQQMENLLNAMQLVGLSAWAPRTALPAQFKVAYRSQMAHGRRTCSIVFSIDKTHPNKILRAVQTASKTNHCLKTMKFSIAIKLLTSIMISVFAAIGVAAHAKDTYSLPERMKSAINQQAKKNAGDQSIIKFEQSEPKNHRISLTVTEQVAKNSALSNEYKIVFYDCDVSFASCQSIRFEKAKQIADASNACGEYWTKSFRFGRVSLKDIGVLSLDMTQLIFKGMTPGDFEFVVGIWNAIERDFNEVLQPGGKCNPNGAREPVERSQTTFDIKTE